MAIFVYAIKEIVRYHNDYAPNEIILQQERKFIKTLKGQLIKAFNASAKETLKSYEIRHFVSFCGDILSLQQNPLAGILKRI